MWVNNHYQIKDKRVIEDFIKDNSFGTLISQTETYPQGSHIPMEWEPDPNGQAVLRGHLARTNPQWKNFNKFPRVLAIFQSPVHHYISSSWYEKPNVPTWDYMSVHIEGSIKIIEGAALWDSLRRLTDTYESVSRNPVSLDSLPLKVQDQIRGIVGFEIKIEVTNASFKMSQNRSEKDYESIIAELKALNTAESRLMAHTLSEMKKAN